MLPAIIVNHSFAKRTMLSWNMCGIQIQTPGFKQHTAHNNNNNKYSNSKHANKKKKNNNKLNYYFELIWIFPRRLSNVVWTIQTISNLKSSWTNKTYFFLFAFSFVYTQRRRNGHTFSSIVTWFFFLQQKTIKKRTNQIKLKENTRKSIWKLCFVWREIGHFRRK